MEDQQHKPDAPTKPERITKIIYIKPATVALLARYAPIYGSEGELIDALLENLRKRDERANLHKDGGMVDD